MENKTENLERRVKIIERKLNIKNSIHETFGADIYNNSNVDLNFEAKLPKINFSMANAINQLDLKLPNIENWIDYSRLKNLLLSCKMVIPDFNILKKIPAFRIQDIKNIKHQKINIDSHIRFSKLEINDILKDQSSLFREILDMEKPKLKKIANEFGNQKFKKK